MTERPIQPEPEQPGNRAEPGPPDPLDGDGSGLDPRELELPASLTAGLRARYGAPVEVPAYVDAVVLTEWAEHLAGGGAGRWGASAPGRRRAWQFAGLAAAVAAMVWVGSTMMNRAPAPAGQVLADGAALGAAARESAPSRALAAEALSKSVDPRKPAAGTAGGPAGPAAGLALATVDADRNGKVNVLDVLRVAKTVQAVQYARQAGGGPGLSPEAAKKLAFFVESLDVTWDLTGDGVVDQKDVDLMASRVVKVGG